MKIIYLSWFIWHERRISSFIVWPWKKRPGISGCSSFAEPMDRDVSQKKTMAVASLSDGIGWWRVPIVSLVIDNKNLTTCFHLQGHYYYMMTILYTQTNKTIKNIYSRIGCRFSFILMGADVCFCFFAPLLDCDRWRRSVINTWPSAGCPNRVEIRLSASHDWPSTWWTCQWTSRSMAYQW